MNLAEIQHEMRRLVDEAEREIDAIKRAMATSEALDSAPAAPDAPARLAPPAATPPAQPPTLRRRMALLRSS